MHLHSVDDRVMSAMTIIATAAVMGSAMKSTVELSVVALFSVIIDPVTLIVGMGRAVTIVDLVTTTIRVLYSRESVVDVWAEVRTISYYTGVRRNLDCTQCQVRMDHCILDSCGLRC